MMNRRFLIITLTVLFVAGVGFGVWFFFGRKGSSPRTASMASPQTASSPAAQNQPLSAEDRAKRFVPSPPPGSVSAHPLAVPEAMRSSSTDMNDPILREAFMYHPYPGTGTRASANAASTSSAASPKPATDATLDSDKDGLTDIEETTVYHTDPHSADTDGDGLTDDQEIKTYHTNPRTVDTDDDGLTDYQEVTVYHTNPNLKDTDGDGFSDGVEV
ncbi:MAG: binary toxin-like calcium binding domain-containing protein, partial [Candidatus Shapirobacteria bacterium]